MSVKDYAEELNIGVDELLSVCDSLGINVKNENDELTDDDIVMLDIELSSENNLSEELESKYEFEDRAEEILEGTKLKDEVVVKKQKIKKKDSSKEEFCIKRKIFISIKRNFKVIKMSLMMMLFFIKKV